jgi:carboxyl-terminal processing protease
MVRKTIGVVVFAGVFLVAGYALGATDGLGIAAVQDEEELFEPFWQTWDMLHSIYVDTETLDDASLMEAALRGILAETGDPNTTYMTPEEFEAANEDLEGSYEGIGAYVRKDDVSGALVIVSVIPNSPALEAGIQAGDAIYQVDGEDVTHLEQDQMISQVRGPEGSGVLLGLRREGVPGLLEIKVTRARVQVPSVESEMIDDIAYIRLNQFGALTAAEHHETLESLLAQDPAGLILDLRGNPGGYLGTVVEISGDYMDGVVLIERSAEGDLEHIADDDGIAEDIPMVVLVNQGSASASEILAGALQDSGRATVIGTTTYGKGTVQSWRFLSNGGGVRMTTARWYTPNGDPVDGVGLPPDIEVNWPAYAVLDYFDPQLQAALRVLDGLPIWETWPLPLPLGYFHRLP